LNSSIKGSYDFYDNNLKTMQSYNFQIELESRIQQFLVTGSYNGKIRLPLGVVSEQT